MPQTQELLNRYDDAMFAFSSGDFRGAISILHALLADAPDHLDARLALSMCYCRTGDLPAAIREGHLAENLSPDEQLVHTNLSLFYMKAGDKTAAERHGLKARIASWKTPPQSTPGEVPVTPMPPPAIRTKHLASRPEMPWKQNPSPNPPTP